MDLLSSIAALVVFYLLWSLAKWIKNYQAARTIGFPIYLCPVNPQTLLWMIFAVPLRPLLRRYLPRALYNHIRSSIYGWEFLHRHESTFPLGSSFTLVSPGHHEVWITDPEIASAILIRRKDFLQARVVCRKSCSPNGVPSLLTAARNHGPVRAEYRDGNSFSACA